MRFILISTIAVGIICGLIPLIFGFVKGYKLLAIEGFISCVIGGAILGILIAGPAAILFIWLILKQENKDHTKICPYCKARIPIESIVCKYCTRDIK